MRRILLTLLLSFASPALAQTTGSLGPSSPVLKSSITVASDIVRIGDFIDNAGAAAAIPIFRAPDLGATGAVPAARVLEAARAHGLLGVETAGISEVRVTRASRAVTAREIEAQIAQAVAEQRGIGDAGQIAVKLDRPAHTVQVEPAVTAPLRVLRLSDDARSGNFDIVLDLPGNETARGWPLHFTGSAVEMVPTALLTRPVSRGEVLHSTDIVLAQRPKGEAGTDFIDKAEIAVGLAVRRGLGAGQVLRRGDLMKPDLIARNDIVTLVFQMPGIVLTSRGKALDSGAQGDTVAVINTQSNRRVQGTVTAAGTVLVAAMTPQFANAFSPPAADRLAALQPRNE
ncbi:MAG TPA: flagellar basal body P-ring formation chaperone FlgA [Xanthobacteraceae bacterium]|nr:flagellar basal body P-ring formation chaperone FlgA [Xanthobacteraceae bacterium]